MHTDWYIIQQLFGLMFGYINEDITTEVDFNHGEPNSNIKPL